MNQLVTKAMEFASLEPISPINDEGGGGGGGEHEGHMLHTKVFIGILCSVVVLLAVIGNSLVVSVIIRYKQLQNATNYILLSLAIADITVTFLVMIPAMIQDVTLEWIFPDFFCKVYNAFDITCCTASILHLLLVAIDRYIAIFKPLKYRDFVRNRNVFSAVFLVWLVSLCMSFIPIFMGWNLMEVDHSTMIKSSLNMSTTTTTTTTTTTKYICSIEANVTYAIISSSLSFWIPLVVMTLLYIRIYIVAKRQAAAMAQFANMHQNLHNNSHHSQHNNHNHNGNNHHENSISKPHQNHNSLASNHQTKSGGFRNSSKSTVISRDISLSTNIVSGGGGGIKPSNSTTVVAVANMNDQQLHELNRILAENGAVGDESTMAARNSDDVTASVVINAGSVSNGAPATHNNGTTGGDKKSRILRLIKQLKSIEKRRSKDTKAIKTLGIIMGIFIICWLPFFYMYMYCALTKKSFDWKLERLITWTGYVNSFINPIVYALTNKDFRKAYMSTLKLVSEKICPDKVYQMTFEKKPTKSSSGLNFDSSSPGSRSTRFKTPINMLRNSVSRHRSCKKTSDNNNSNTNRQQQEEEEREVMVNKKEKEVEQKTPIYNNNNKIDSNHQTVDHNNNEIVSSNNIINNDTEVNVNNVKLKSNFTEDVKNFDYIDYDTMFNESGNNTPKSPLRKAIGNGGPVVGAVINETTTAITTITKTVPKKASTKLSLTSFLYRNRLSSKTAGNNSNQQSDKDNNEIILCRV